MALFARQWSKTSKASQQDQSGDESMFERSFASTMSLGSPSQSFEMPGNQFLAPGHHAQHSPMDVSPCPQSYGYSKASSSSGLRLDVPGQQPRSFGRDVGNSPTASNDDSNKGRQRSALPFEWMAASPLHRLNKSSSTAPGLTDDDSFDRSKDSDAMEVDSPEQLLHKYGPPSPSLRHGPASALPPVTNNDLGALFYNTASPVAPPPNKKRRSMSPDTLLNASSFLPGEGSPLPRKFDRFATTGHGSNLFKKPSAPNLSVAGGAKRAPRPVLSALLTQTAAGETLPSASGTHSSYPVMQTSGPANEERQPRPAAIPVRRAFSALAPPQNMATLFSADLSSDDVSAELDSSPAGAYSRRQDNRVVRKADGSASFRPVHGAGALDQLARDQVKGKASPIPQFGDIESNGKVLPCERVKDDGLMRITPETLCDLLDGHYDDKIDSFMVIDCRFDYEFKGGHVPGAVNLNVPEQIDRLLLSNGVVPEPCLSGDGQAKRVLIFHCELSQQRGPTLAKHLRQRDRALNNEVYPRLHYPEVYILQGGYKHWFATCPDRCEPRGYVIMDDSKHIDACEQNMDQFRKFSRARSYTYGDRPSVSARLGAPSTRPGQPHRNSASMSTLPPPPPLFGGGHGVSQRSRRGTSNSVLDTLMEAGDTSRDSADGVDDSPCPPTAKIAAFRAGTLKGRTFERSATMSRAY